MAIVGVVSAEGVECPAIRGQDGRLYTLTGAVGRIEVGDEVEISGDLARFSVCQQGVTINVRSLKVTAPSGSGRPPR